MIDVSCKKCGSGVFRVEVAEKYNPDDRNYGRIVCVSCKHRITLAEIREIAIRQPHLEPKSRPERRIL